VAREFVDFSASSDPVVEEAVKARASFVDAFDAAKTPRSARREWWPMAEKSRGGKDKGKAPAQERGPFQEIDHGTQDELEVLLMIVKEQPLVRTLVLDRLRAAKARVEKRGGAPKKAG
jgi:hypothetical protein